mgnify:FL=1
MDNRADGYFKNLEYFQISGHKAASFEETAEDAALQRDVRAGSRDADPVVWLVSEMVFVVLNGFAILEKKQIEVNCLENTASGFNHC